MFLTRVLFRSAKYPQVEQEFIEGFPLLKVLPKKKSIFDERTKWTRPSRYQTPKGREHKMDDKQDWPSVWPTAKTFVPSAVPLPLRQSFEETVKKAPRFKYCNTELLKVVNFLHLTPGAIERQCAALKKFCNEWPEGLETDQEVSSHFPVTYVTRDYVHSSPSIRDVRARIVELKVKLADLKLNARDEDKLIRLAAHRYKDGMLTIAVTACPTKTQNLDYADYLMTALYFESIKHEKWEDEQTEQDRWKGDHIDYESYRLKVEKMLGL